MFYHFHAAPALLVLMIGCALPSCVLSQCSRTNPAGCTSCADCVGSGVGNGYGIWYSANNNNCGGVGVSGTCMADGSSSKISVPCRDVNGNRNYYAAMPSACTSCSAVASNKLGSCSDACSADTPANCYTNQQCAQFGSGYWWFNSDRSNTQSGKSGLCYKSSIRWPCDSWLLRSLGGSSSASYSGSCTSSNTCQDCIDRGGVFIKSSSSSSSGTCYQSYSTCDKSYYNWLFDGCSTSSCIKETCGSGGDCTTPAPVPAPGPAPGPGPSSSACTSSQSYNCNNCAACTGAGNYWSSDSPSNPSASYSSNTYGTCYSTYSSAPCNSYVFSWCTSSSSFSPTYRSCVDNSLLYVVIAVPLVIWLINIIAIAAVARRRGLNVCIYVILAAFFSVFAWFCLCCGSSRTGGQALIGRIGGVELKSMNVQAYAATSSGSYASNFQAQPSAHDPYSANVLSKPSETANAVSNPYAANNASNPYSQSPAPAPYANAVPDAYNPYAANSGAASAPPYEQPHAPAFRSSASTPSPQPAAVDQYSQNVFTQSSAENSQNEPVIMPY